MSALAALSAAASLRAPIRQFAVSPAKTAPPAPPLPHLCPSGSLPDLHACVPIPPQLPTPGLPMPTTRGIHADRGARQAYEHIPRRPDRPMDFATYQMPIAPPTSGPFLLSPYDLDLPDRAQRPARGSGAVGHGGIDLAQQRGAPVRAISLEHQHEAATVMFVGPLFGTSVVTRHTVLEPGRYREYLLIYGHLNSVAPNLRVGQDVQPGDVLGTVGDSGSEGNVHLHLEVRQVRDGVGDSELQAPSLVDPSVSIPCDPRNVLPLVAPAE